MDQFVGEGNSCMVEQAKGALMLRYGIGAPESLAVLDRWSHEAGIPVEEVARTLVHGICLGQVDVGAEATVRWLEQRLRREVGDVREPDAPPASRPRGRSVTPTGPRSGGRVGTAAGATAGSAKGEGAVQGTVPTPTRAVVGPRQWRYSSAVHAARVLHSR